MRERVDVSWTLLMMDTQLDVDDILVDGCLRC